MTDKEAYKLIGERAAQLTARQDIQAKMVDIVKSGGTVEQAEKWLYSVAIATLCISLIS